MGLNILFFAIMIINGVGIFQPEVQHLVEWGAKVRLLTEGGDWWRLGSAMFMHIGIIHLLLNMYALFSIGVHLEAAMGRWKFLAAYLATGILANVTSIWWHENTASAGASGAIFGMYGVFSLYSPRNSSIRMHKKVALQHRNFCCLQPALWNEGRHR